MKYFPFVETNHFWLKMISCDIERAKYWPRMWITAIELKLISVTHSILITRYLLPPSFSRSCFLFIIVSAVEFSVFWLINTVCSQIDATLSSITTGWSFSIVCFCLITKCSLWWSSCWSSLVSTGCSLACDGFCLVFVSVSTGCSLACDGFCLITVSVSTGCSLACDSFHLTIVSTGCSHWVVPVLVL